MRHDRHGTTVGETRRPWETLRYTKRHREVQEDTVGETVEIQEETGRNIWRHRETQETKEGTGRDSETEGDMWKHREILGDL